MNSEIDKILAPLRGVDWSSPPHVAEIAGPALRALSNRKLLKILTVAAAASPALIALSEHYDILDKLVLHNDSSGFRIRLHIFLPGHFDRPHNHRWSYASLVLRGRYRHDIYGTDDGLNEGIDPANLSPVLSRHEEVGSFYALHHTMVHAVVAEPYTISLVVRGPAIKERFLVMDRITNQAWWQYGAASESQAVHEQKGMSPNYIQEVLRTLESMSIL